MNMPDNPYQPPQTIETATPSSTVGDSLIWRIARAALLGGAGFGLYTLLLYRITSHGLDREQALSGLLVATAMVTSEFFYLPNNDGTHSIIRRLMISTSLLYFTFVTVVSLLRPPFQGLSVAPPARPLEFPLWIWLPIVLTYVLVIALVRIAIKSQSKPTLKQ